MEPLSMSLKRISAAILSIVFILGPEPDMPIPRYGSPFSALQQFQVHGRSDSRDKIESDAPYQSISAFSITEVQMQTMQVCILRDR